MLKTNIKLALRHLFKRKFNSLLNIVTLTLGASCCVLIYMYVSYQMNFDTYHKNTERLYRLVFELRLENETEYDKGSSIAMVNTLKSAFPLVEKAVVSINRQSFVIDVEANPKRRFREEGNISFTDAEWFDVFTYSWIEGNPNLLNRPGGVILTKKVAEKYFGAGSATGKMISIVGKQFQVAGVVKDPANTDMKGEMYISLSSFADLNPAVGKDYFTSWGYTMSTHDAFILLKDARQKKEVENKLASLVDQHMGAGYSRLFSFQLMPLKDMHFDMRYAGTISKSLIITLSLIGLVILCIAGINYINLVIAQQTRRSAEIGTRKILGGSAKQIFFQFLIESFLVSVIAIISSLVIIILLIPQINSHIFYDEPLQILSYSRLFLFSFSLLAALTLFAGAYPAYILSRLNVSNALKNNVKSSSSLTTRSLIVIQNVVAQVLIIGTIIVLLQVRFLKNTDKGFDRESVVMIPFEKITDQQKQLMNQRLKGIPGVESFSFCYQSPASDTRRGATVKYDVRAEWEPSPARFSIGDSAYFSTFRIPLKYGRTISPSAARPEYVINETMARSLEPKDFSRVVGKKLMAGDLEGIIVGVSGDFNLRSLRSPIEPVVFMEDDFLITNLAVKLSGSETQASLEQVKTVYEDAFSDQLFTYQFVDERIAKLYQRESLQQKFIWIASAVAIAISSMGLLALISLVTVHRTKEIGVRKVLGASVAQITILLSSELMKLIVVSFVIASPISFYLMSNWLRDFAYRIDIHWWVFALSGGAAALIAFATISFQAIKAAIANPVESLRSE
ncbi:ABC transporter permease [Daejeonella lutea]|uniref:FtsX-like permease family protein n=1 Tax=Daejeonella lutea TaxID=572036 RepID=A0A1T5A8D2_9SPHI|nr:ABC transporter permease [Daejeonella lutea]SKB31282.1 FtsX-like permease family protein [Daejeonella lutea]